MIALWRYRILNQISLWTVCRVCGKRNRRYRYCGGDNGCQWRSSVGRLEIHHA